MKIILILALAGLLLLSGCLDIFKFEEDAFCRENFGEDWFADFSFAELSGSFYCSNGGTIHWFPFLKNFSGEWAYYNPQCSSEIMVFDLQEYKHYSDLDNREKLCYGYQEEVPEEPVEELMDINYMARVDVNVIQIQEPTCLKSRDINVQITNSKSVEIFCNYIDVDGVLKANLWTPSPGTGYISSCGRFVDANSYEPLEKFKADCLAGEFAVKDTLSCRYFFISEEIIEEKQFCECWSDEPCAEELVK